MSKKVMKDLQRTIEYEQLLSEYCGFRADIIVARACCEKQRSAGYPPMPILSPEDQLQLVARHLDSALRRTATIQAPYRLIDLRDGRVWDFQSGEQVTDMMFVLTMWPLHAAVYKHGVRWNEPLAGEIGILARALDLWEPIKE
jgi:hypothetical protein